MAVQIVREVNIDVSRENTFRAIYAKQYDRETRYVVAHILDNGNKLDIPSNSTVTLNVCRPDDKKKMFKGEVLSNGSVQVPIPFWALEIEGEVTCDITIFPGDGAVAKTFTFSMIVEASVYNGDDLPDDSNYGLLIELIADVQALSVRTEAGEENRRVGEEARITAENDRVTAEQARSKAEQIREDNELIRQNTYYRGMTAETERVNNEMARTENEELRVKNEKARVAAEADRVTAEQQRAEEEASRATSEGERVTAENSRSTAETERVQNENNRQSSEANRSKAESTRVSNENTRIANENVRTKNEELRATNEQTREGNEVERQTKEAERLSAESARVTNESSRVSAESTRKSNEETRVANENKRVVAESDRVTEEGKRVTSETARSTAEEQRAANENARISAEQTRESKENERQSAETVRDTNEKARVSAESERSTAEQQRANNEQQRVEAEQNRTTEETQRVATFESLTEEWATAIRNINQASEEAEKIEQIYAKADSFYASLLDDTNTSTIFKKWYSVVNDGTVSRYDLLDRWFKMLALNNDQQHTVRLYAAEASSNSAGTPLDWLEDKTAAPLATDTVDPGEGWDEENRITWYIRANALSLADGTMNIIAIEGIDDDFDITGETAPVYTFQMCPFFKQEFTDEYEIYSWRANKADGYRPWEVDPTNAKRSMTWHPTFDGSKTNTGNRLTSGSGRVVWNFLTAASAVSYIRNWNNYEGLWGDSDTKWLLFEWIHRHFNKENSGILEGCTGYNYQYPVAIAEEGVKRVVLSASNGANYVAGSCVAIGDRGTNTNNDRNQGYMRNIVSFAEILEKNTVSIDGTDYVELILDLSDTITTTTTTYVSTMPWKTGSTECLPGHRDGSRGSLTNGKYPLRVAGIEALIGAYAIGLDPLYNVTAGSASGKWNYEVYECRDSEHIGSSISSYYEDTGIGYTDMPQGWQYVKKFKKTSKAILFPETIGGSSTGYFKSAFYGTYSAGVRCPRRFGALTDGGVAGLACEDGHYAPSNSNWNGVPRLSGSGKKRGELTE